MSQYHWPGNVRELENLLMQAILEIKPDRPVIRDLAWTEPFLKKCLGKKITTETFPSQYEKWKKSGLSNQDISKQMGVSIRTLYRYLGKHK